MPYFSVDIIAGGVGSVLFHLKFGHINAYFNVKIFGKKCKIPE